MRLIKILLSLAMALMAIIYATQNVMNLETAHATVGYVLGMGENAVYPKSFLPAITNSGLVWAAIGTIITFEYLAGLLLLIGTFKLWGARNSDAMGFDMAKKTTLIGCGVGMLVWFGLFHVIGGALFQMWQTEIGDGSLRGAFWFGGMLAFSALYISLTPDA